MLVPVPARGQTIELTVWYPAIAKSSPEAVGGNKIFRGTPALRDAALVDGRYPVVLMAHGGFRSASYHESWLAVYLAARGTIVVVARPPALGPRDAQAAVQEIWLRPADLSSALTAIENDTVLSAHLEPGKAAIVGFFLGGTSALALAGGRLDAQSYMRSCDNPETGVDCAWFAKNGVDLRRINASHLTRAHLDSRIKAAVAIDPELSQSFSPESLAAIKVPVDIINLGEAGKISQALDASSLARGISGAHYDTVPDAVPFSAFSLCTPKGPILLQEEGDDAICRDGGNRARAELHSEIAGKVEAALKRGLSDQR